VFYLKDHWRRSNVVSYFELAASFKFWPQYSIFVTIGCGLPTSHLYWFDLTGIAENSVHFFQYAL
jgi:hypothetical protein